MRHISAVCTVLLSASQKSHLLKCCVCSIGLVLPMPSLSTETVDCVKLSYSGTEAPSIKLFIRGSVTWATNQPNKRWLGI